MRHTLGRYSTSLSLLALLAACSGGDVSFQGTFAAEEEVELEEGTYGLVRKGSLSFGDSEASWTIYAHKPLKFDMWLIGSDGSIGGRTSFAQSEGSCVYHIRFSQEQVDGSDLLDYVGVLGGEEASAAVKTAVPSIEGHSAFRYSLELETSETEVDMESISIALFEGQTINTSKKTSSSSSGGWVPGSIQRGEREGGFATSSTRGMEGTLEHLTLGEPLFLGYCVELPTGTGSISTRESGDEFMIRYAFDSQEVREVPIDEYEGRAWVLKLTLTEAD